MIYIADLPYEERKEKILRQYASVESQISFSDPSYPVRGLPPEILELLCDVVVGIAEGTSVDILGKNHTLSSYVFKNPKELYDTDITLVFYHYNHVTNSVRGVPHYEKFSKLKAKRRGKKIDDILDE